MGDDLSRLMTHNELGGSRNRSSRCVLRFSSRSSDFFFVSLCICVCACMYVRVRARARSPAYVRFDYVDEDTSWHFAIGLRSQDSATRCPCALNKCENSACARSSYAYLAERGEFLTYAYAYDQRPSLVSLPSPVPLPPTLAARDPSPFLRFSTARTGTLSRVSLRKCLRCNNNLGSDS